MNTSKQVNVMIGLLFVFIVSVFLYFLWDSVRAEKAEERQLEVNAERGGRLYSLNCRVCHGLTGKGPLENPNLPGIPLNIEANRPQEFGKLQALQARLRDTIKCGRVGTLMPPWSQEQGGSLNDFLIEQLVTLITSAASEKGWEAAIKEANHADYLGKQLRESVSATETVFTLNDARGLKPGDWLRIDDDPLDDQYEVVEVVDAPAQGRLLADVGPQDTELPVENAQAFLIGDVIVVEKERMRVVAVSEEALGVERGVDGTKARKHSLETPVYELGDQIEVKRGIFSTRATDHAAGAEVFAGPLEPPSGPLIGETGVAPCGQRGISPTPTPTAQATPVPVSGSITLEMGDNFFQLDGQRNPTLEVKAGQKITVSLVNIGQAIHNGRTSGSDNEFLTDDDHVSDPDIVSPGQEATLEFSFDQPGTYQYRCDFHPVDMKGTIVVTQ